MAYSAGRRQRRRIGMAGGRIGGIISVVLAAAAAVAGVLNYTTHHPRRGLAALIACGVLLVLGVVLVVVGRGKGAVTADSGK
jgi:hypothetical protein